ncbi:hypothetical protein MTO96_000442 [Rhipicephalus appendiculatus]
MADGGGTHEIMQALLEQNRRLLELFERKSEAFHVMPVLNKAIHDFDGEGSCHEAGALAEEYRFHGGPARLAGQLHTRKRQASHEETCSILASGPFP